MYKLQAQRKAREESMEAGVDCVVIKEGDFSDDYTWDTLPLIHALNAHESIITTWRDGKVVEQK